MPMLLGPCQPGSLSYWPPQQCLPALPTPSALKHLPLTFLPTTRACSPPGHTQPCSSQTPSLPTSKVTAMLSSPSAPLHALCTPAVLQSHGFGHTPTCRRCPGAAGSLGLPLTSHTNCKLKTSLQCCIQGPLIPSVLSSCGFPISFIKNSRSSGPTPRLLSLPTTQASSIHPDSRAHWLHTENISRI